MSTNKPMAQEQLHAIRGRLSDVGAPWEFAPTPDGDGGEVIRVGEQGGPIAWGIDIDAAGLIAHAPQDLADLLAEVERLRALTTVDKEMIERGARAYCEYPIPGVDAAHRMSWERLAKTSPHNAATYRDGIRAVLGAALDTGEGS